MMLIGGAALASADGELNICSPNSDGLLSIIPVFEEQTGIKVKVESIGTGDCMKRIGSEIAQEYSTFDLMYGGSLANYVANADLFQDYVSDQDQYLMDAYKNTRGYCTNYTIDGSVLLVNTDMLKELGVKPTRSLPAPLVDRALDEEGMPASAPPPQEMEPGSPAT